MKILLTFLFLFQNLLLAQMHNPSLLNTSTVDTKHKGQYIGILESSQSTEHLSEYKARLLFVKISSKWELVKFKFDTIPNNWTIAFDGKNRGKVSNIDMNKTFRVLNKAKHFQSWFGAPKYRPIVIVKKPYYKDPQKWRPFKPNNSYRVLLYKRLKEIIGTSAVKCKDYDNSTAKTYDIKTNELTLQKSYRSNNGKELIAIGMDYKNYTCDGPPPAEWGITWFLIDNKKIKFIGHNLNLVDAGDYDNDGESEIVFWYSGYNRDGYKIFYNNFTQSEMLTWGYH